jgi:hypothetical protein
MTKYITKEMLTLVQKSIPTLRMWVDKFHLGHTEIGFWHRSLPDKSKVRRYRYSYYNTGGVLGISYQEVDRIISNSDTDCTQFIAKNQTD